VELEIMEQEFSICKVKDISSFDFSRKFYFLSKTDEEISLVCTTEDIPDPVIQKDEGWRALRIRGILDFSLTGILAAISTLLADHKIGIFAVSTFNTDYILTKAENFAKALRILAAAGYRIAK
jgi:uncharacterized protein